MDDLSRAAGSWGRLRKHGGFAAAFYRVFAFAIAVAQILAFRPHTDFLIQPSWLVFGMGLHTIASIILSVLLTPSTTVVRVGLASDVIFSTFPMVLTGGVNSPCLAYALTPILASSLSLDRRVTGAVALVSVTLVFGSQLMVPSYRSDIGPQELKAISFYLVAAALTALMPYVINARLKEQWRYQDTVDERRRVSRELHDGPAQTTAAMRWQLQRLRSRLKVMGIQVDELNEVERLAEIGQTEVRDSLEILRTSVGDGHFIQHLREHIESLRRQTSMDLLLRVDVVDLNLASPVEAELLYICQEALSNAVRHSGARNAVLSISPAKDGVQLRISDNGRGLDLASLHREGANGSGHGLAVMQERAVAIGADFHIFSKPGGGTEIVVVAPANKRRHKVRRGEQRSDGSADRQV